MTLILPKTCSVGGSKTGLVGIIGVTLLNPNGTIHTVRDTAGIYEIGGGCYGKNISFPDDWKGSLKWDTGGGSPVYAVDEYNTKATLGSEEVTTDAASRTASKATGFAVPNEYDTQMGYIPPNLGDVPTAAELIAAHGMGAWTTADISNLDVAVSTRNAVTPPTTSEIRAEMEGADTKLTDVHNEAFGKWILDPSAKTLTLYKADGIAVLKTFDLTDTTSTVPAFITRTPQ